MARRLVCRIVFLLAVVIVCGPVFGQGSRSPEWTHGLEMKARKADEKDFSDKTRSYGVEAYVDRNLNNLVYLAETGSISALPAAGFSPPKSIMGPKWLAAMNLQVRKAGEAKFTDSTRKVGIEVFRDENTGTLIYISETGSIAAFRGTSGAAGEGPQHQYGYELRVRKGTEGDFTDATKKYGVEVFKDPASNALIYISETGAIAVLPAGSISGGNEARPPKWTHGLNVRVRKAGEKDFSDTTKKWGIEVFKDEKAANLIYIAENGDLGVLPARDFKGVEESKGPAWLHAMEVRVRRSGEKEFTAGTRKWGIEIFRDENTGNVLYVTEIGTLAVLPPK
jgi:hypothetical protein